MLPNILTGGRTPTRLDYLMTILAVYWHRRMIFYFLKGKRELLRPFCWGTINTCRILSASSMEFTSVSWVSYWAMVSFLLSYRRLLTGTLWICIVLEVSPIATTTWLLSLIFLVLLMMRLGVRSRSLVVLAIAEVPERIREFLGIFLSFSFSLRISLRGCVFKLLRVCLLVLGMLVFIILSFWDRIVFSAYYFGCTTLFYIHPELLGLFNRAKADRSIEIIV
jgi:hypothetical protein